MQSRTALAALGIGLAVALVGILAVASAAGFVADHSNSSGMSHTDGEHQMNGNHFDHADGEQNSQHTTAHTDDAHVRCRQ